MAALVALAPLLQRAGGKILILASVSLAALLVWELPALPWEVVAWGHHQLPHEVYRADLLDVGEGMQFDKG